MSDGDVLRYFGPLQILVIPLLALMILRLSHHSGVGASGQRHLFVFERIHCASVESLRGILQVVVVDEHMGGDIWELRTDRLLLLVALDELAGARLKFYELSGRFCAVHDIHMHII